MRKFTRLQAGFTLTELMAVVVIIGVLAVTGITYFRQHALASKVTEAQAMVQSIRAAEERYKAENRQYLNVLGDQPFSAMPSCSSNALYPAKPDGGRRPFFFAASNDPINTLWRALRPTAPSTVQFGYAVRAGPASSANRVPLPPDLVRPPLMPMPTDSWYVIEAYADNDTDGVCCLVVATSLTGELYVQNEGE